MKKRYLIPAGLALFVIGALFVANRRRDNEINEAWQGSMRSRVERDILLLNREGVDTSKARGLCLKDYMGYNDAQACLNELESEVRTLN